MYIETISGGLIAAARQSKKEKKYWINKLADQLIKSSFTFDHPLTVPGEESPKTGGANLNKVKFEISGQLFSKLSWMINGSDVRLHMILTAILNVLLYKYTRNKDIIIGAPIYKQDIKGDFINKVLILKNRLEDDMTFKELLFQVRNTIKEAVDNQNYPIKAILYDLKLPFNEGDFQLFDTIILLENIHYRQYIEGINYNILFSFSRTPETLEGVVEYKRNRFAKPTIERIISQFLHVAQCLVFNVDMKVTEVEVVPPEEKRQLLGELNANPIGCRETKTIHELFADQFKRSPNRVAVVYDDQQMTYRELHERGNRLARVLRARNVQPDIIVGLMIERSPEMIVGMLGILKSGGAYLPIALNCPQERLDYMLADSGVNVLVTSSTTAKEGERLRRLEAKKNLEIVFLDSFENANFYPATLPPLRPSSSSLAYIIYTSGSTGQPKGVLVEHSNAVNVVIWFAQEHHLDHHSKVLQLSAYTFDASVNQIFGTLLHAAVLCLVKTEWLANIKTLRQYMEKNRMTLINFVPLFLKELLLEHPRIKTLTTVISGGESLEDSLKDKFLEKGYILYNQYGPTETTIDALAARCSHETVTLGKPILNTACYIMDNAGHLCPIGVIGELCVAGAGVSRGYLNNPGKTAEKFTLYYPTQAAVPLRVYRTGDLVRLLPDGNFQFIGRSDNQLKIRGYRIELEEIERQILTHEGIKQTVVLAKEDGRGEKYLCAYITPQNNELKPLPGDHPTVDFDKKVKTHQEFTLTDMNFNGDLFISKRFSDFSGHENGNSKQSLVTHFEQVVRKNGGETAIKSSSQSLNFDSLNQLTNRLAWLIRQQYDDSGQLTGNERKRYSRQLLLDQWGIESQEKLKEITVFIAGAGGIGSQIIQQLALLGIGTMIICDNDQVELSNLNRQSLHDESRLGMNKALSAKETVRRINPHVNVKICQQKVTAENIDELIGDSQLIFDCVDDLETKFVLSEAAVARQIPHVLSGMIEINSYAALLHAPRTPCFHCLHDRGKVDEINQLKKVVENYQKTPFPVAAPALFVTTGFVCNEALKIILGFENPAYNKFFLFNQKGSRRIVETNGYKQMTYSFNDHFKGICKKQGFDWNKCWHGRFVEELSIEPDPHCPICAKQTQTKIKKQPPGNPRNQVVRSNPGAEPGENSSQVVVSLLEPQVDRIIGMLAVLKSGKIYAPLDMTLPAEKLVYLLEKTGSRLVLTGSRNLHLAVKIRDSVNKRIPVINIDEMNQDQTVPVENLNIDIYPDQVAYLLYRWNSRPETISPTTPGLKKYLSQKLPEYMIPTCFVPIDQIPLTHNGKIDREALPEPETGELKENDAAVKNWVEQKLSEIWSQVLGIEKNKISMSSNFFDLGGHSLRATTLIAKINKELDVTLPLAEIFRAPTIRALAEYIEQASEDRHASIQPAEKKEYYALSSMQNRLYILQQMDLKNTVYNMPQIVEVEEKLEKEKLEDTLAKLIRRHESLRTSFVSVNDEPMQNIHERAAFKIEYHEAEDNAAIIENFVRPFDLFQAPLLRVGVILLEKKKYLLMVDMHHIISDGVSNYLLIRDFNSLDAGDELPPLRLQYKDYQQWLNKPGQVEVVKKQENFWLKEFEGEIPVLDLALDYQRPAIQSFAGKTLYFELSTEETNALNHLARAEDATLFMVLMAVFNVLLSKISNQDDIIIGSPIAGRRHNDLQQIIGLFINTLALRNFPRGYKTFKEFLGEVKERTLNAFENQEYQLENLVEKVVVNRDPGRNPLFDVMFALQNVGSGTDAGNEASEETSQQSITYKYENRTARFDMTWNCNEEGGQLSIGVEYCTKLFKEGTILRFIDYFKKIVSIVVESADKTISEIEIIPEEEKKKILYEFNSTTSTYPVDKTIHELFKGQVKRSPDCMVLAWRASNVDPMKENSCLTGKQLDEKSDRLALMLKDKGVETDDIVGILVNRSLEMVMGIVAVLKAGGAYLPIDPKYPQKRIEYMLTDSHTHILLTQMDVLNQPENFTFEGEVINILDETIYLRDEVQLKSPSFPGNLAYVMYTSGSTGKPKGVMIEHQSVLRLVKNTNYIHLTGNGEDRLLLTGSVAFDITTFEIWASVLNGISLYLTDERVILDGEKLGRILVENKISILHLIPQLFNQLAAQHLDIFSGLKYFLIGGDAVRPDYVNELVNQYKSVKVLHMYGPTENTTFSTFFPVNNAYEKSIPIGKPISNSTTYIVDSCGGLQTIGTAGELLVGGDGVARGYLNNPELTSEKFINYKLPNTNRKETTSPHYPITPLSYSPIYKTGDSARWLSDGNIEFLGRIDLQVKIRGIRIELGEIESRLLSHDDIQEVILLAKENESGDKYLCAYFVSGSELKISGLREFLSEYFPDYMIPSYFMPINQIPLNSNGKVNRKTLPEPQVEIPGEDYVASVDEVEEKLVEIWSDILEIEKNIISTKADFFELGGHSLKATAMVSKINKEFHVVLPLAEVFQHPQINLISKYIKRVKKDLYLSLQSAEEGIESVKDDCLILLKPGISGDKHHFFIHDGTGKVEGYIEFCKRLPNRFNYWGLCAEGWENLAPRHCAIEELARKYLEKIKKVQPHGPYCLEGWSLGGTIAFEMALQLERRHEHVAFLGLFDAPGPRKGLKDEVRKFTVESEVKWVWEYLPGHKIKEKVRNASNINEIWSIIEAHLEENNVPTEIIKRLIPDDMVRIIPDYDHLGIKELIYYLNLNRTLTNARNFYIPIKKINTTIYYFRASQSPKIFQDCWNDYCLKPMKSYEVTGDHFSILKKTRVDHIVKIFNSVFNKCYNNKPNK